MPLFLKRKKPIKKIAEFIPEIKPSLSFSSNLDFSLLYKFQKEWASADNWSLQYTVIRKWWPTVCDIKIPEVDAELLQTRIGYELQASAYIEARIPMPKSVLQNLQAIREFRVDRMTQRMSKFMGIIMESKKQGEVKMGNKKVKANKKEVRQGVSAFYLEIFAGQAVSALTDEQIAKAIEGKTGSLPTLKNVASYRCMYNAGKLQGQKNVPSGKVKAVRAKSDRPAKPKVTMSEETKAKLKAYSAKKKASKNKK